MAHTKAGRVVGLGCGFIICVVFLALYVRFQNHDPNFHDAIDTHNKDYAEFVRKTKGEQAYQALLADVAAIRANPDGMKQKAIDELRSSLDGLEVHSDTAEITATDIFGGENDRWMVEGRYVGFDRQGRKFQVFWKSEITIRDGKLQCITREFPFNPRNRFYLP